MTTKQRFKWVVWSVLACSGAWAQNSVRPPANTANTANAADWVEAAVPPAPAFSKEGLLPLDMPPHVSLKLGIDPSTIAVGPDGVVRYVVVMTNTSGSVSAAFEGVHCITDEVKTYARWSPSGTWTPVSDPQWKSVNDNMPSKHAHAFARQGGCLNRLATSPAEIIAALKMKTINQLREQKF
jgi:hypothetical protein